jgi:hypothetical protein
MIKWLKKIEQAIHLGMMPFIVNSNFKLKTSLTRYRTYHLDACTSKHAHPPYAHTIFEMSFTNWNLGHVSYKILWSSPIPICS